MLTFAIPVEKTLRLGATSHDVLNRMKPLIDEWSGRDDQHVHFYEPHSLCLRTTAPPFAYWRIDAPAFEHFGPLPFTAEGKPARWGWWYWLRNSPTLTVSTTDLPERPA